VSGTAAQKHHHYKLIDMGTFGGPESWVNETIIGVTASRDISLQGMVGGSAISIPTTATSNPFFCGGLSGLVPFVNHAFAWRKGIVTDLGTLAEAANCSVASAINSNGAIVGASETGEIDPLVGFNQSHAVQWKDGRTADLGTLGGYESNAASINNRGLVAGLATNAIPDSFACFGIGTQCRAALWRDGTIQDLGTLGGPEAFAVLINERNQIVGAANTDSLPSSNCFLTRTTHPFLWQNGRMTDLGTLGGTCALPLALNNRGQVVGISNLPGDAISHPFLSPGAEGKMQDLGTLGGDFGNPNAISESGEVVGYSNAIVGGPSFAFLSRKGVMINLGTLDGDSCSTANSLNSKGQVVGISTATCDFSAGRRAFLWEDGSMVDLNTLIPPNSGIQLNLAETINDRGEIAVNGSPAGCDVVENCGHAVLLIPCDGNHPDIEGCDYSPVEVSAVATTHTPADTGPHKKLTPQESSRIRALLMNRHRGFLPRTTE
jgi:probable HAF family extracellular repeat protein